VKLKLGAFAVVLVTIAGCTKTSEDSPAEPARAQANAGEAERDVAQLRTLRDALCACTNATCAAAVQAEVDAWSQARAARPSTVPPTAAVQHEAIMLAGELSRCREAALRAPPPDAAAPARPEAPASVAAPYPADDVLRAARQWLASERPMLVPAQATLSYVDRDGNFDAEHGRLLLYTGYVSEKLDDPRRKTGAPVIAPARRPDRCTQLTWQAGGWEVREWSCRAVLPHVPGCAVKTVWERAIANAAPADALAVITLEARDDKSPPAWRFAITDDLRGVKVRHTFADDCPLAVEQPASP